MQRKYFSLNRSARYGANALVMILIVFGIVVLIGAISMRHHFRFDLTQKKRHTLSDETLKVLNSVKSEVSAIAFYQENSADWKKTEGLLKLYRYRNNKFSYRFVDPDRNPALAKDYGIIDYGAIILKSGKNESRVSWGNEEKITNALLKVIRDKKKVLYFLKGHGENDITRLAYKDGYGETKKVLQGQNYEVKELSLLSTKDIPEDASVFIISGPQKEPLENEIETIKAYIKSGGNLLVMIDPFFVPEFVTFMEGYNIRFSEDIVIDELSQLFGGNYLMPIVSDYEHHRITKDFNINTLFPLARSIQIVKKFKEGIRVEPLIKTNEGTWGETDKKKLDQGKASFEEGQDNKGPLTIAAVVTIEEVAKNEDKTLSRMVVFGDSDFANNSYINVLGNKDIFLNTINWLAEEEDLISIRAKDPDYLPVILSKTMGRVIFYVPVVVIPVLILGLGVIVMILKRRKS